MVSTVPERLRRHRLKVSEYLRMGEARILPTDARVELIEGEIIDMAPINSPHSGTVIRLTQWLSMRVGGRVLVSVQNPIVLGTYSAPQPDIALLRPREDFYTTVHPGPEDVLLVIEVADTTLRDDREVKVPLYGAHGIPEVWLIDVESKAVQVFRAFEGGQYRNVFTVRGAGSLAPVLLADVRIDVSQLL
jgi:Uma2 family endonuclease